MEDNAAHAKVTPPDSVPSSLGSNEGGSSNPPPYDRHRDRSPLPAPTPKKISHLPRDSLDGETIFAVGDEDKWTDDEADGEEREGLVGKGH